MRYFSSLTASLRRGPSHHFRLLALLLAGNALRTTGRKLVGQLRTAFEPIDTRMDSLGEEPEFAAMATEYKKARQLVNGGRRPAARRPARARRGPRATAQFPPLLPDGKGIFSFLPFSPFLFSLLTRLGCPTALRFLLFLFCFSPLFFASIILFL